MADATFPRVAQGGQVPLVGRTRETAWLRDLLQHAAAGEARVALIQGESGVGKSRLLREFLQEADDTGWQTLWGRYTAEPAPAHAPLLATLAEQARRGGLLNERAYAELQATDVEPLRRAETFARLAQNLAERRPLVLVLDDLHLAESTAVALFCELARCIADAARTRPVRLLVIATLHPQLPGDSLGEALDRLRRETVTASLELHGLGEPEVAEVLRHSFHGRCQPPLIDAVHRASQGNPFFVLQLASTLLAGDMLVEEAGGYRTRTPAGELVLPVTAPEALRTRIESLAPEVVRILQTASLLGDDFELEDLAAACAPADPGRAIDEAVGLGLIEERGRLFAFHHHLVRHAFMQSMGPVERRTAHRRIAEALLERFGDGPDHLVPIALHLLDANGGGRDQLELGQIYERAGDAAMTVFARAVALRLYEASLATAPYVATLTKPQLGWLQCRTGRVNDNAGNRPRARELYFGAISNLRGSTDFEAWGLAVLSWERTFTNASEPIPTDQYEGEFAEASGEAGRDLRIRLLTQRADALQLARDSSDLGIAHQAVELAHGSEDPAVKAEALVTLGLVQIRHLQPQAALASFDAGSREGAGLSNPIYRGWGWTRRAWPLIAMGDLELAQQSASESANFARRNGDWAGTALAGTFLHSVSLLRTENRDRADHGEARLMMTRGQYFQPGFFLHSAVAWGRLLAGEFEEALDAVQAWAVIAGRSNAAPLQHLIRAANGEQESVRSDLRDHPWRTPGRGLVDATSVGTLCTSAELAGVLESEEIADQVYDALAPLPGRGIAFSLAPPILIHRSLGVCARVLGRWSQARDHLERAYMAAGAAGAVTERSLTAIELLRIDCMVGAPQATSRDRAAAALAHFRNCELVWPMAIAREHLGPTSEAALLTVSADELNSVERDVLTQFAHGASESHIAAQLLLSERTVRSCLARARRRLGIHSRVDAARYVARPGQEQPGLAELTPRERQVLRLLAYGKTNAEIADELVISQHTAIRHVANILEKTGSPNRTAAAALIRDIPADPEKIR